MTVGDVLAHAAGLPGIVERLAPEDALDGPRTFGLLAAQSPMLPVGQPSYHARTYGLLCDALSRRADGRSIARVVADEVAAPLGLETWIGVPDAVLPRIARLRRADDFDLARVPRARAGSAARARLPQPAAVRPGLERAGGAAGRDPGRERRHDGAQPGPHVRVPGLRRQPGRRAPRAAGDPCSRPPRAQRRRRSAVGPAAALRRGLRARGHALGARAGRRRVRPHGLGRLVARSVARRCAPASRS